MAKVVKKIATVEFDSKDVWHIAKSFSTFEAVAVGFELELNYGRLQDVDEETKVAMADLVQEIRRTAKHLETFLPQEVRSF